jgi:hypothetical protein
MSFQKKYLKYKQKYLDLKYKNQKGGASYDPDLELAIKESLNPRYSGIPLVCKQEAARTNGFIYIDIPPDGNCLYHCIARHMGKTHSKVREEITDYIDSNRAQFTRIPGQIEEGIDEYLTKQRRLKVYGDYTIILAAAALYNIHILVYTLTHDQTNNTCSFIQPIDEYNIRTNIVTNRRIMSPSKQPLCLSHESVIHYGYLETKLESSNSNQNSISTGVGAGVGAGGGGGNTSNTSNTNNTGNRPVTSNTNNSSNTSNTINTGNRPVTSNTNNTSNTSNTNNTGNRPVTSNTNNNGNRPLTNTTNTNTTNTTNTNTTNTNTNSGIGNRPFTNTTNTNTGNRPFTNTTNTGNRPFTNTTNTGNRPFTNTTNTGNRPFTNTNTGNRPVTSNSTFGSAVGTYSNSNRPFGSAVGTYSNSNRPFGSAVGTYSNSNRPVTSNSTSTYGNDNRYNSNDNRYNSNDNRYNSNSIDADDNVTIIFEQIEILENELANIKYEIEQTYTETDIINLQIRERELKLELSNLKELINESLKKKYLKYKQKYLHLKNMNKI